MGFEPAINFLSNDFKTFALTTKPFFLITYYYKFNKLNIYCQPTLFIKLIAFELNSPSC